jgi:YhcH/YjgK/YiaL family protein
MIYDTLSNQALYRDLHPGFAACFDWLKTFDPSMPDGKVEIDERAFALIQSYATAPANEKRFETHVERIDIQYISQGSELMQCAPAGTLRLETPYDPARDAAFYADPSLCVSIPCGPGSFTIFFPNDGHKGACSISGPSSVKKVCFKIRV